MKKVLIAGGSGFIGGYLCRELLRNDYQPVILSRDLKVITKMPYPAKVITWDELPAAKGFEAVINLSGTGIFDVSWNSQGKKALTDSRVGPSQKIRQWVESLPEAQRPQVIVQASAVGYYGDDGGNELTEDSPVGKGFAAELCEAWEGSWQGFTAARSCLLRIPSVLGHGGGMIEKLDGVYASGMGACLASGEQWLSWIHIEDLCRLMVQCLKDKEYSGVINAVAPNPLRFKRFHELFCIAKKVKGQPLSVPAAVLRFLYPNGQARVLLDSQKVIPKKAVRWGFHWKFNTMEDALADLYDNTYAAGCFVLYSQQWVKIKKDECWNFFSSEKNLEKITPAELNFHVVSKSTPQLEKDTLIHYRLRLRGIPFYWRTRIVDWQPKSFFSDFQEKGPYKVWYHEHKFEEVAGGIWMIDRVQYKLPMGWLGTWVAGWLVHRDVRRIFAHRHKVLLGLFNKSLLPEKSK